MQQSRDQLIFRNDQQNIILIDVQEKNSLKQSVSHGWLEIHYPTGLLTELLRN